MEVQFESVGIILGVHGYFTSSIGKVLQIVVPVMCIEVFDNLEDNVLGCFWVILEMFTLALASEVALPFLFSCLLTLCRFALHAFSLRMDFSQI